MLPSSHFALNWRCCTVLGERCSGGIWKFRTSSFKCYVDHSHTMYSSGNIDVRNWVNLFESRCISNSKLWICTYEDLLIATEVFTVVSIWIKLGSTFQRLRQICTRMFAFWHYSRQDYAVWHLRFSQLCCWRFKILWDVTCRRFEGYVGTVSFETTGNTQGPSVSSE